MLRTFFGHHKTASTWVRTILADVSRTLKLDNRTIHTEVNYAPYATLREMIDAEHPDLVVVTNGRREVSESLPPNLGFHVIRDPRDIMVSAYFSHLHSHPISFGGVDWPELAQLREELKHVSEAEGLLKEIDFLAPLIDGIATWDYHQPHILEVKMEELVDQPELWWTRILEHLQWLAPEGVTDPGPGLLPRQYVKDLPEKFSFDKMSGGRSKGEEDVTSHYRRGVAGDWKNHLDDTHIEKFRATFGDLVERLGYSW